MDPENNPLVSSHTSKSTLGMTMNSSMDVKAFSSTSTSQSDNNNGVTNGSYFSTKLPRELAFCIMFFLVGVHAPNTIILPIYGRNIRPIPYQKLPNSEDVVLDFSLNQPLIENVTIPSNFLIQTAITMPIVILVLVTTIIAPRIKPKFHDVHSSICVLLTTTGMSEFITQVVKLYVGRLRPNFYALCGFDTVSLSCTNPTEMIMEGRSSFPSGHSSLATAGMGCLVYFFLGRVGIAAICGGIGNKKMNSFTKLYAFFALTPLLYSTFCASSRLVDNWHHPSDVLAGICLGLFCSTFGYHLW
jgi:membrane-associated phospholipid phosphatase